MRSLIFVFQRESDEALSHLDAQLSARPLSVPTAVAVEKFIMTPGAGRKAGASNTAPLVGEVRSITTRYLDVAFAEQTSADAARGFPNPLLRRLGLNVTPKRVGQKDANDANSAVRHALLWVMRNRADIITTLMKNVNLT